MEGIKLIPQNIQIRRRYFDCILEKEFTVKDFLKKKQNCFKSMLLVRTRKKDKQYLFTQTAKRLYMYYMSIQTL